MKENKLFENVEIKNLISIVAMVVFLGINVFGCVIGKFEDVFEFDKQIITVVVSFFLGSKLGSKVESKVEEYDSEPISGNFEQRCDMTNREYLNQKTSPGIGIWLDEAYVDKSPVIEEVKTNWADFPNFKPGEFVCPCGKCEYSKPEGVMNLDYKLLYILQAIRNKFGVVQITCGARCKEYNDSLQGSIENSKHTQLKAADFHISGVTNTVSGRNTVLDFAKKLPGYSYGYHNSNGKYPNMGAAIHVDVK